MYLLSVYLGTHRMWSWIQLQETMTVFWAPFQRFCGYLIQMLKYPEQVTESFRVDFVRILSSKKVTQANTTNFYETSTVHFTSSSRWMLFQSTIWTSSCQFSILVLLNNWQRPVGIWLTTLLFWMSWKIKNLKQRSQKMNWWRVCIKLRNLSRFQIEDRKCQTLERSREWSM